jgi:hypothetical protein
MSWWLEDRILSRPVSGAFRAGPAAAMDRPAPSRRENKLEDEGRVIGALLSAAVPGRSDYRRFGGPPQRPAGTISGRKKSRVFASKL